jgi:hypothetical protein
MSDKECFPAKDQRHLNWLNDLFLDKAEGAKEDVSQSSATTLPHLL